MKREKLARIHHYQADGGKTKQKAQETRDFLHYDVPASFIVGLTAHAEISSQPILTHLHRESETKMAESADFF